MHERTIRVGNTYRTNEGSECVVVSRERYDEIVVEFTDTYKHQTTVTGSQLLDGRVSNPYYPSRWGTGFIGVGPHSPFSGGDGTRPYRAWYAMLTRCYSVRGLEVSQSYVDCTVDPVWHNYQTFADWFIRQNKDPAWQLDKDILVQGNRVYSPEACRLVPATINNIVALRSSSESDLPVGVSQDGDKFSAAITHHSSTADLGSYDYPYLAFAAYRRAKLGYIREAADKYKEDLDPEIYEALLSFQINP